MWKIPQFCNVNRGALGERARSALPPRVRPQDCSLEEGAAVDLLVLGLGARAAGRESRSAREAEILVRLALSGAEV